YEFHLINQQSSKTAKSRLSSQYGLRLLPGPLDPILWNHHLNTPQDAYHAIAGKVARLLDCTCTILALHGENNLINHWRNFEVPIQWSHLPNPITHQHSFMISDNLKILMIFPFILKRCLTINSVKKDFLKSTCDRLHFSHRSEVLSYIIHTWVLSAKAAKEAFSLTIHGLMNILTYKLFWIMIDYARQYTTCINTAVGTKEIVHRIFKAIVPHTNKRNLELNLLQQINTLQTLRHLVDNGIDDRIPHYSTRSIFMPLIIAPRLCHLLSGWCTNDFSLLIHHSNDIFNELQIEDNSNTITNNVLLNRSEIKLGLRWNKSRIEAAGFISTNIVLNGLFKDIMRAYSLYYSFEQALLDTQVLFYDNVSYTMSKPNGDHHNVKLKVGEIVETKLCGENEQTFGKITSIIEHSWNDSQIYVFLCFDWLEDLNRWDSLLDCPIYRIRHSHNGSLNRVHPISVVSQSSSIPFIHHCKSSCSFSQHDTTNN
ncbi:35561_t:CDS:2, partial [Racocetra persica]